MSDITGKKFFLKVCTKCGRQYTDENLFKEHLKKCGCVVSNNPERKMTLSEAIDASKIKKAIPNILLKEDDSKDDGFSELDKVTQKTIIEKPAECVTKEAEVVTVVEPVIEPIIVVEPTPVIAPVVQIEKPIEKEVKPVVEVPEKKKAGRPAAVVNKKK